MTTTLWKTAATVYAKEIVDALRDRRTLLSVFLSSIAMGPLLMFVLSLVISGIEERAEKRELIVAAAERAPTLVNYLQRQTYTVKPAPADYEQRLRDGTLDEPVIVIPGGFEDGLARGEAPLVEVVVDSGSKTGGVGASRVARLLRGFSSERASLALALRGVAGAVLEPIEVEERDVASTRTRGAQFTAMLPLFVVMAVLYGALNAALDSTAGERERGSLEPLLMTPADHLAIVIGKCAAVASVSVLVATLSCLSFIPAQWLLRSDTLQAMFQYGWAEAFRFIAVLVPFAAAAAAALMAVAIRCRTYKEAQANGQVVLLFVSLMPLITLVGNSVESAWHLWVPGLAQNVLMMRVLKGEPFGATQLLVPLLVCTVLAAGGVWIVSRSLRQAAVK